MTIINEGIASELLEALRRDSGAGDLGYRVEPTPIGGGFWAEILTFELERAPTSLAGELVAKITPSRMHGEREALVQAAVAGQGYPAPPVLARGSGPRTGGFYFVMPKADGSPPLAAAKSSALLRSVPSLALRLPKLLADLAARLHRLDPAPLRDALTSRPGWTVDVDDLVVDIATAADRLVDRELAAAITTMLAARPQPEHDTVICHGDFHPLNIIVGAVDTTVVDWTAARIGPPAFDVAFTALLLARPPIEVGPALARPLHLAGGWLARRFVAEYRRQARVDEWELRDEELSWYTQLHAARILIDVTERGDAADGHPFGMLVGPALKLLGHGHAVSNRS